MKSEGSWMSNSDLSSSESINMPRLSVEALAEENWITENNMIFPWGQAAPKFWRLPFLHDDYWSAREVSYLPDHFLACRSHREQADNYSQLKTLKFTEYKKKSVYEMYSLR